MKVEFNNIIYCVDNIEQFLTTIYFEQCTDNRLTYEQTLKSFKWDICKKMKRHFKFLNDDWFIWRGNKTLPYIKIYR